MVSAMSVRLNDRASHSRYFSDELGLNEKVNSTF